MAIRITVTLDAERQRQSGADEQSETEILALLEAMREDGRLSLQSRGYWVPVQNLRVRLAP